MPLPTDEKLLRLAEDLLQQIDTIFGLHPGFRPVHAKGVLLSGSFKPSREAATLSRAAHLNRESTPVTVRFSDGTGIPVIPDTDPNASPRGFAVRFHLRDRVHTDIIGHSTDGFPARTGQEFLEFLRAVAASGDPSTPHPTPVEAYLGTHPTALAFVQAPKPVPSSFARESYFGLTAMRFINENGDSRHGRYRVIPEDGNDFLDSTAVAALGPNFLFDELMKRIAQAPIRFRFVVQLADPGDVVDDVTVHWPEERTLLEVGMLALTEPVRDDAHEQKNIIFDPIPRVDGIDPSDDPLLEFRAAIYLMSGRRCRAAPEAAAQGSHTAA